MKKLYMGLLLAPLFMVGCSKNKQIYASSKNTIYNFEVENDEVTITGLNDKYKSQTDIIIPYSIDKKQVKKIGNSAFFKINRIKSVDMSKSKVVEIGSNAFEKCGTLTEIFLPETIEKIDSGAFKDCVSLEEFDLSTYNISEICDYTFSGCTSLSSIILPDNSTKIGSYVFSDCNSMTEFDFSNTKIEEFADNSFSNLSNLLRVTFPDTLKVIGNNAFYEDRKITFVNLSKTSLESIGEKAFYNCRQLITVNLPASLKTIGKKAFYYCSKLDSIDLSKTVVEEIPESCFELCISLTQAKLSNCKTISSKAFFNSSITSIEIPATVASIADDALVMCQNLAKITVSEDNQNYLSDSDILYTKGKTKLLVYAPKKTDKLFESYEYTTTINAYAFANAKNLEEVKLDASTIKTINDYTFMNCISLKTFTCIENATDGIKKIGFKAFFGCTNLEGISKMPALEEIGESAFFDCVNLATVDLKDTKVYLIGDEAFCNCSQMSKLTIPGTENLTIGRKAFDGCGKLGEETGIIIYGSNHDSLDTLMNKCKDCGLYNYYIAGKITCS